MTRSASDGNLSKEVFQQPHVVSEDDGLVAFALFGLMLLPGIPAFRLLYSYPLFRLSPIFLIAIMVQILLKTDQDDVAETGDDSAASDDPYALLPIEPIEVHVGSSWAPLSRRLVVCSWNVSHYFVSSMQMELGFSVLPMVKFKDGKKLAPNRCEIPDRWCGGR